MGNYLYDALMGDKADSEKVFLQTPEGRTLTFRDMHRMAGRMARALRRAGVKSSDRICVQAEKSPEILGLYLAALRSGAVFQPLNMAYTPAEVGYFIDDARPALVICDPARKQELKPLTEAAGARLATLDADGGGSFNMLAMVQPESFETEECGPNDLAAMLYTSGTTGRSKGAMITHGNLLANARDLEDIWRFSADDTLIHALPVYHAHGLFVAVNVSLLAGAGLIFLPKFDAGAVIAAMPQASVLMGVPTFYARLLQADGLEEAAKNMRLFISGSAPLSPAIHAAFRERTGHAILERYGLTETGMNTSNPYDGERRPGSVGFPLPSVELRITEPATGKELAQGETGMIEVRGANVFPGYWRMEEKTKEAFREDGWFITGDLGFIDKDGYVHIAGRDKDLVITGGLNVYPAEVEAAIDAIEGVAEAAVIGLPDDEWGETVCAVVAREKGAELTEADILEQLKEKLARFKQPRKVIFVDALPRNAMGKVQKTVLRERYGV